MVKTVRTGGTKGELAFSGANKVLLMPRIPVVLKENLSWMKNLRFVPCSCAIVGKFLKVR